MACNSPKADSSSFFDAYFGFVPRVFRVQAGLPGVVEAEAVMAASILGGGSLTQVETERIVLATASARQNVYWVTLSYQTLLVLGLTENEFEQIMRGAAGPYRESTEPALLVTAWANLHLCNCDRPCRGAGFRAGRDSRWSAAYFSRSAGSRGIESSVIRARDGASGRQFSYLRTQGSH